MTNVLGRHMSDVSGNKEVYELLRHLLVSDCVPLLSRERHKTLRLVADIFSRDNTPSTGYGYGFG